MKRLGYHKDFSRTPPTPTTECFAFTPCFMFAHANVVQELKGSSGVGIMCLVAAAEEDRQAGLQEQAGQKMQAVQSYRCAHGRTQNAMPAFTRYVEFVLPTYFRFSEIDFDLKGRVEMSIPRRRATIDIGEAKMQLDYGKVGC